MKVCFTLSLTVVSLFFSACVFFGPSNKRLLLNAYEKKPYDVIIVPGRPYDSAATDWNLAMKGRLFWAKYLYDAGIAKHVMFSGAAVYTPFKEAVIMGMFAEKMGIPSEHIFAESRAEHSTENIYYSYYLAKKLGFEKIAVATDPFQGRLLRRYPKRINIDIDIIPFVIDSLKTVEDFSYIEIDTERAKVKNFVSIEDRESRYKRFWGTLGRNVKRDEQDVRMKQ